MHIRTVEIENYRAFKKFEIKLSPLSLIIGENEKTFTKLSSTTKKMMKSKL